METVVAELARDCPGLDEVDLRAVVNQSAVELTGVAPADLTVRLRLRVRGRVNAALGRPRWSRPRERADAHGAG